MICPCCHREAPDAKTPSELLATLPIQGMRRQILGMLVASFGEWVTTAHIIHELWADDIDGGPIDPCQNISVHIYRLRKYVEPLGFNLESMNGPGSQGRRLVWAQMKARAA